MRYTLTHLVIASLAGLCLGVLGGYFIGSRSASVSDTSSTSTSTSRIPANFEECVQAGNPVMESYPRQCRSNGTTFVENVTESETPLADPRQGRTGDGCLIGGCGGELCGEAGNDPLVSICMLTPQQACYKTTRCEKQSNGKCGWTETAELKACLQSPPPLQ